MAVVAGIVGALELVEKLYEKWEKIPEDQRDHIVDVILSFPGMIAHIAQSQDVNPRDAAHPRTTAELRAAINRRLAARGLGPMPGTPEPEPVPEPAPAPAPVESKPSEDQPPDTPGPEAGPKP